MIRRAEEQRNTSFFRQNEGTSKGELCERRNLIIIIFHV